MHFTRRQRVFAEVYTSCFDYGRLDVETRPLSYANHEDEETPQSRNARGSGEMWLVQDDPLTATVNTAQVSLVMRLRENLCLKKTSVAP